MKFIEFITALKGMQSLTFRMPTGETIPAHFHITEVGVDTKNYIDCGGTKRAESKVVFQIWVANDTDHRLKAEKLLDIVELAEAIHGYQDLEVEFEYQGETICKYGIQNSLGQFLFVNKFTDCLAKDQCGIPEYKTKKSLVELTPSNGSTCTPGGGCC
jgi:archaellin